MNASGSSEGLSSERSAAADASERSGAGFDLPLDLAARSRMASLRDAMFGVSAEPTRVDRFIILETLGAGGMGVVHAAHDPRLDRRIALKLVRPEAAAGAAVEARLLREAQAMARLSHPNVVQIHEVGAWEGRVFIAMELVAGQSLAAWLAVRARGWREIVGVFLEAGRGLAAAHDAGIIHRDFKPENVMVGTDGRVRVMDFGLARGDRTAQACGETWREPAGPLASLVAGVTVGTAGLAGTPRYMSPEQFRGESATSASDQFSYCVALYQALHGIHPFAGEDRAALAQAVIAGKRREPPRIRIPRAIHRALVRGLSRDPEARFSRMPELLAAIEPRSPWRLTAPAALFLLTGAGVAGVLIERDHCTDTDALLAGTWDAGRRVATEQAFTESRIDDAPVLWATTSQELGIYTEQVKQSYTASCQAERRGESTEVLHDLRVACLYRRLNVMRGVVGELVVMDLSHERVLGADLGLHRYEHTAIGRSSKHIAAPTRSSSRTATSRSRRRRRCARTPPRPSAASPRHWRSMATTPGTPIGPMRSCSRGRCTSSTDGSTRRSRLTARRERWRSPPGGRRATLSAPPTVTSATSCSRRRTSSRRWVAMKRRSR